MTLKIAQLGQPVLRQVATEVKPEEIATPEFQQFLRDMRATLEQAEGAGLAAPQVFSGRRVFFAMTEVSEDDNAPRHYEVFINPRIVAASPQMERAWEGCLSFIELLVLVPRHVAVRVEYLNEHGEARTIELHDFPARVVQHENDHLNGILTIDRAQSTHDIIKASEIDAVKKSLED